MDNNTGKRTSLRTGSEDEAIQIVQAKNQAERQPILNLQIAKAYLAGSDNGITTRTWQHAIEALTNTKQDANKERWLRVRLRSVHVHHHSLSAVATRTSARKSGFNCRSPGVASRSCLGRPSTSTVDPPPGFGVLPFRIWRGECCLRPEGQP